jgi:hypothetical protein
MVSSGDTVYTRACLNHNSGTLVAKDGRKQPLRILSRQGKSIGVTDSGGLDFDHHLTLPGTVHIDRLDTERLTCLMGDCRTTGYHNSAPLSY